MGILALALAGVGLLLLVFLLIAAHNDKPDDDRWDGGW